MENVKYDGLGTQMARALHKSLRKSRGGSRARDELVYERNSEVVPSIPTPHGPGTPSAFSKFT